LIDVAGMQFRARTTGRIIEIHHGVARGGLLDALEYSGTREAGNSIPMQCRSVTDFAPKGRRFRY
jgi:hypothetical protein